MTANPLDAALKRRGFLKGLGAGVLAVAVPLPAFAQAQQPPAPPPTAAGAAGANVQPRMLTAYVVVQPDGRVLVLSPTSEMGQGTHTAHATLVADELGVDIAAVTVETAIPADPYRWNGNMGSGGSWGVRRWHGHLRKGAAQAREMLIAAAAARLSVPTAALRLEDGRVVHADGRGLPIGDLVEDAAKLTPPADPALKPAEQLRYWGKGAPRLDIPPKTRGAAMYALDVRMPGMVYACAKLTPVFHGDITGYDDTAALTVKGVQQVVRIPGGVAVVADTTWAALKGADAVTLTLAPTDHDALDSAAISAAMREGLGAAEAASAKTEGDVDAAFATAAKLVEADYEVPYLSHAPMEPFAATLLLADGKLEIWAPTQVQDRVLRAATQASGLPAEAIVIHTHLLGGGFGRRLTDEWVAPAVAAARALPGTPVRFFWSRETEFARGWYRPAQMTRLKAALDADGNLTALAIRTAGPSMRMEFVPGSLKPGELDGSSVQDLPNIRYRKGAYRLDYAMRHVPVTLAPWRAVGATQNAFFLECFIDEVAAAAGLDPVAFRRRLLAHDARALKVVETAAEKSGWGTPLPDGRARGIAFFESYGSLSAHVAEVSLADGQPRVHKVAAVLDCGDVVLPDGVRSQLEGGVIQGLSSTLFEAATILKGRAEQVNFDSYRLLTIAEAPEIDVHLIRSGETMGGVGEPGLPPAGPAVVNALSTLLGRRLRMLPVEKALAA